MVSINHKNESYKVLYEDDAEEWLDEQEMDTIVVSSPGVHGRTHNTFSNLSDEPKLDSLLSVGGSTNKDDNNGLDKSIEETNSIKVRYIATNSSSTKRSHPLESCTNYKRNDCGADRSEAEAQLPKETSLPTSVSDNRPKLKETLVPTEDTTSVELGQKMTPLSTSTKTDKKTAPKKALSQPKTVIIRPQRKKWAKSSLSMASALPVCRQQQKKPAELAKNQILEPRQEEIPMQTTTRAAKKQQQKDLVQGHMMEKPKTPHDIASTSEVCHATQKTDPSVTITEQSPCAVEPRRSAGTRSLNQKQVTVDPCVDFPSAAVTQQQMPRETMNQNGKKTVNIPSKALHKEKEGAESTDLAMDEVVACFDRQKIRTIVNNPRCVTMENSSENLVHGKTVSPKNTESSSFEQVAENQSVAIAEANAPKDHPESPKHSLVSLPESMSTLNEADKKESSQMNSPHQAVLGRRQKNQKTQNIVHRHEATASSNSDDNDTSTIVKGPVNYSVANESKTGTGVQMVNDNSNCTEVKNCDSVTKGPSTDKKDGTVPTKGTPTTNAWQSLPSASATKTPVTKAKSTKKQSHTLSKNNIDSQLTEIIKESTSAAQEKREHNISPKEKTVDTVSQANANQHSGMARERSKEVVQMKVHDQNELLNLARFMVTIPDSVPPTHSLKRIDRVGDTVVHDKRAAVISTSPATRRINTTSQKECHDVKCCPVCGQRIGGLEIIPMDWTKLLCKENDKVALRALISHTGACHPNEPIWNTLGESVFPTPKEFTPTLLAKYAIRKTVESTYPDDETLHDFQKLRDLFVRRMGIARGYIMWGCNPLLSSSKKLTSDESITISPDEMKHLALKKISEMENLLVKNIFVWNQQAMMQFAETENLARWRNLVQIIVFSEFLAPPFVSMRLNLD